MNTRKHKAQRPVAAKSNKRGGRSKVASHNPQRTQHPWKKIATTLRRTFGVGIYVDTMEFALEHLHEEGVETASLFNAKTGEATKKGLELIEAAVDEGWGKTVDLAECDNYGSKSELTSLLADQSVFDYVKADLVKRGYLKKPEAMPQVTGTTTN